MVGLALVLLALRARNILICQLDSVVSYSARSRRCSNCMHAQKSLAFFVCGLCRSHFVISSVFFFFLFSLASLRRRVRCFLVFQEHGMKFLRVFKLNVGTLYLADGKNQVAYFEILRSSRSISSFSPSWIPQHNNKSHISFAKNSRFLSAFYAFASLFFWSVGFVCVKWGIVVCSFFPSLLWELLSRLQFAGLISIQFLGFFLKNWLSYAKSVKTLAESFHNSFFIVSFFMAYFRIFIRLICEF